MSYSKIRELNGTKDTWSIEVRLTRLWEAADFKNEKDVFGLEMVFVDAQGDSIQGYIRKNHMARFKSMLKEGDVYGIKNFKVGKASPHYRVVPNELRIFFNVTTSVRRSTSSNNDIPLHAFSFVPEDTLDERIGNNTTLTDIIGCVIGVGPVENAATGPKRELELKNNQDSLMRVTLWGSLASTFDSAPYEVDSTPMIAIITSTTVRKFKGEFSYRSNTATKVYVNLHLPEVNALSEAFAGGYKGLKPLDHVPREAVPLAEQASVNRKTISEILALEWAGENQEFFCTFVGEIVEINERYSWCYISCNSCSKKVVPKDGTFVCKPCNKTCLYPVMRHKIHARARDTSGSTTLVIFNDDVERFAKIPTTTFLERVGTGESGLPQEISNMLLGKPFIFKIKVTDYNLKDGLENYTVNRIFQVDVAEHKRKVNEENSGSIGTSSGELDSVAGNGEEVTPPITPQKQAAELKKIKREQ